MTRSNWCTAVVTGLVILFAAGCGDKKSSGDPECGNDSIEGDEVCDGTDLAGETCDSLGLGTGDLACTGTCGLDTSGCETASVCGDTLITGDEACDGSNLSGMTCELMGLGTGDLACSDSCGWDTTGCETASICGDDHVTGDELCDGDSLGTPARTCVDEGFTGGDLACAGTCDAFDTTGCTNEEDCGDDLITGEEVCDGENLGDPARTCVDEGFRGGDLACMETCLAFDVTGCTNTSECGNDAVEFPEECDGSVPDGADCTTRGFYGGTVTCGTDCMLDVSSCDEGYCGDGEQNGPEGCEGTDFGSPATGCDDLGFTAGDIACNVDCTFDISGCTGGCGNGVREGSEVCDGEDLDSQTCADEGFVTGPLGCAADCSGYDTSSCLDASPCTDDASLGELFIGDIAVAAGDTTGATDDVTLSCVSSSATASPEVIYELVIMETGMLTIGTDNFWHVIGIMEDAAAAGSCFGSELGCLDPYFYGNPINAGIFQPGRYFLVVSDWSEADSLAFGLTVTLNGPSDEICHDGFDNDGDTDADCDDADCASSPFCIDETNCTNGEDDDLDFAVDCADSDCMTTADCIGSACTPDTELGVMEYGIPDGDNVNVADASNDLSLSCSPSDGPDTVYSFTLDEEAPVVVNFDQETGSAHAVGLFAQAGAGSACDDAELLCWDVSAATTSPTIEAGSLGTLPAGTYYFIVEGTATGAGNVDVQIIAYTDTETSCDDGYDNDGDGDADCGDFECLGDSACAATDCVADHDFGTVDIGSTVTHTGDTSTSSNVVNLSCSTTDGNDYITSFTLSEPAMVYTEIDQVSGTGHATALTFTAGSGTGCTAAENLCLDLSGGDYAPDASGFLSYPDPLPAGTYFMIAEAITTAGSIDFLFTAYATSETVCDDDIDDDGDGALDCADEDCASVPGCTETDCGDDTDNDGDTLVDCDDSDCAEEAVCIESDCDDGTDNDDDGATDCYDSDCAEDEACDGFAKGIFEQFVPADMDEFDLANGMLTFTPAAWHPQGYVWSFTASIPGLPIASGTGSTTQPLVLDDDEAAAITLSTFSTGFDFYGVNYPTVNVSSNGLITLGVGNENASYSDSPTGLFGQPAIAPLWDDLSPDSSGSVTWDEFATFAAATYSAVPEFGPAGASTFQTVLWADGHISIAWQDVTCLDPTIGISNGGGSADLPPESNFN